jgi:hypothetical protein
LNRADVWLVYDRNVIEVRVQIFTEFEIPAASARTIFHEGLGTTARRVC